MTEVAFAKQIARLKVKWPQQYDTETVTLIWDQMKAVSDDWFKTLVDRFIGNRKHWEPPMLEDFRGAVVRSEFKREVKQATKHMPSMDVKAVDEGSRGPNALERYLVLNFPGCKSAREAAERLTAKHLRVRKPDDEPDGAA